MDVYERARDEADMWVSMGQGVVLQAAESYPELLEEVPSMSDIPDALFEEHLNPIGADKLVHAGAFYGGTKATMKTMDWLMDEPSDELLIAGGFVATTVAGGAIEHMDAYFDMADMAADYVGWYLASESYLEEGPTEKMMNAVEERFSPDESLSETSLEYDGGEEQESEYRPETEEVEDF